MRQDVRELWPELEWIEDRELRERTARTWELALDQSPLGPQDLQHIPFTLLVKDCPVSFMAHKRAVVHIAREAARAMQSFFGEALPIEMDVLIAGAILADVGKLLEYDLREGKAVVGRTGRYLRHPFTGVALARQCGVPDEVCHIVAAHAGEGEQVVRSTEACIVHHADFMSFDPFKTLDRWK